MRFLRLRTGQTRWLAGVLAGATALFLVTAAWAAPSGVESAAKARLLGALHPGKSAEGASIHANPDGTVRYLLAPPGGFFKGQSAAKSGGVDAAAKAFVAEQATAFGVSQPGITFRTVSVQYYNGLSYVRLQQQYKGVDILGAQIVVQMNGALGVPSVMSEVLTDTTALENGSVSMTPAINADDAVERAIEEMARLNPGIGAGEFEKFGDPALLLYSPAIVDKTGGVCLVWSVGVAAKDASAGICETVLVDASSGNSPFHYSQIARLNNRRIWDANNSLYAWSAVYDSLSDLGFCSLLDVLANPADSQLYRNYIRGMEARSEGDPVCGITDADQLYDVVGGAYDYYSGRFGRDGWDGAGGMFLGVVRLPEFWSDITSVMYSPGCALALGRFPEGMIQDDVVGHEYTHAVTGSINPYIYEGESGAIAEGYSDAFGEFIDWTWHSENDAPEARWFVGEDTPSSVTGFNIYGGSIRYMKDPTVFGNPDRFYSPYWNSEAHTAAGVHSKLTYLLTDGDTFNGYVIQGMGVHSVEDLLYSALPMMVPAGGYYDFAYTLSSAAISLNWSFDDRLNLANAIRAVEIEPPSGGVVAGLSGLTNFRATPTRDTNGRPVVSLSWENPSISFGDVRLQRSVVGFPQTLDDSQLVTNGSLDRYLDTDVQAGVTYFYTLIATMDTGLPQLAFARVVADAPAPAALSEVFGYDPTTGTHGPLDLAFTQLTYSPVGPPSGQYGGPSASGTLDDYELTVVRPITSLPVSKGSDVTDLSLAKDGTVYFGFGSDLFPYFGRSYSNCILGANGYLSFVPWVDTASLNIPSLGAHYAIPRISLLFSRLDPQNSASVWVKHLADRVVVTFDHVREVANNLTTTVQAELFFGGQIRLTYLEVNTKNAIVGLSDGRGLLQNPSDLFQSVESVPVTTDLSNASATAARLSIAPIAPQYVQEGDSVVFEATATPAGTKPNWFAEWTGSGQAPFAPQPDGSGIFSWQTTNADAGTYRVRVFAELNGSTTFQDVQVTVANYYPSPTVSEVGLATDLSGDNPFESRSIPYGRAVTAIYTYEHPELLSTPSMYKEGRSIIYWYRNNVLVSAFNNTRTISADQLFPGDSWYFEIIPVTASSIMGQPVTSPRINISGDPVVEEVTPPFGLTTGGQTVRIRGRLFGFMRDGHLVGGAAKVLFGGVSATQVRQISDTEIEVVTPAYSGNISLSATNGDLVDVVDVTVTSSVGTGQLANAFTYKAVKSGDPTDNTNKGTNILGCGSVADTATGGLWDALLLVACGLVLFAARRWRCS